MGDVVRIVLRFDELFWDDQHKKPYLPRLGFLFSSHSTMPTWWSSFPLMAPILTGWVGGPPARALSALPDDTILDRALDSLAAILRLPRAEIDRHLRAWHLHNWSADPFTCGAYSYLRVGGIPAITRLAEPIAGTLFFAGEHTSIDFTGTVHGAIESGYRAAEGVGGEATSI